MLKVDALIIGNKYRRSYLASLWGYKSHKAIEKGIVTSKDTSNKIILFVTNKKESNLAQYNDYFDIENCLLYMDGANSLQNDDRIINSSFCGDEVYLFYREQYRADFEYFGQVYLCDYKKSNEKNKPSKFVFSTDKYISASYSEIILENTGDYLLEKNEDINTAYYIKEGKEKIIKHKSYERNLKNRAEAIKIHGTNCLVCGFNFNKFYGKDIARDFIEVHHLKPLYTYEGGEVIVNPKTDLAPVCANCHRMIHRKMNKTKTIDELKKLIKRIV